MFPSLFADLASVVSGLVIVGDFNDHIDYRPFPCVKQLQTLFSDNCLTQLIRDPTHCRSDILDWILARENSGSVSQSKLHSTCFSDHDAIVSLTALNTSLTYCPGVNSRNPRKIQLRCKLTSRTFFSTKLPHCSDSELADRYSEGLHRVLDQHDPLASRKVARRLSAPLRTERIRTVKRELRQAKRKLQSSGLTISYGTVYHRTTQPACIKQRDSTTMMWYVTLLLLNSCVMFQTSCSVKRKRPLPDNIPSSKLSLILHPFIENKKKRCSQTCPKKTQHNKYATKQQQQQQQQQ